jgi:cytochrome b pre-mRNA-processing protein 3
VILERFLNRRARVEASQRLFEQLNEAARDPLLFDDGLLADEPDGRFEAIALMSAALFVRLAGDDPRFKELGQGVFDRVFRTFDSALRALGVGDLHVGKRIRKMAESYYGRLNAYREPLQAGDRAALEAAIARNCFGSATPVTGREARLAGSVLAWWGRLQATSDGQLLEGAVIEAATVGSD